MDFVDAVGAVELAEARFVEAGRRLERECSPEAVEEFDRANRAFICALDTYRQAMVNEVLSQSSVGKFLKGEGEYCVHTAMVRVENAVGLFFDADEALAEALTKPNKASVMACLKELEGAAREYADSILRFTHSRASEISDVLAMKRDLQAAV